MYVPKFRALCIWFFGCSFVKVSGKIALTDDEVRLLRRLTSAAYGTRYLDVSLRLHSEIYTKTVADEYLQKALPIIERVRARIEAEEK